MIGKAKRKIILCFELVFVMLLSTIMTFSAVVSSDDGAAFVTKQQLEDMKKEFNDSIDNYGKSLNNKIDGAIASYLSGIRVLREENLANSKSILSYPLTIYNDEYDINLTNWNAQTKDTGIFWKPSIDLNGTYAYNTLMEVYKLSLDMYNDNKIKTFYNLVNVDTTKGTAIIDGKLLNYNFWLRMTQLMWLYHSWSGNNKYGIAMRFDQKKGTTVNGASSFTIPASDMVAEGSDLYSTKDDISKNVTSYYINNTMTLSVTAASANNPYSKYSRTSGSGLFYWTYAPTDAVFSNWQSNTTTLKYDKKGEIDKLYTGYKTDLLLPVAYNNYIYYTNYWKLKNDMTRYSGFTHDQKSYYNSEERTSSQICLYSAIDAGWTVEPETQPINSAHKWYNQSLIKGSHVKYYVTTPVKETRYEQSIFDGILITDFPNYDIDVVKLKLNISLESDTNKRYLLVSTKPISQFNPNNVDERDLLDLYKDAVCTDGTETKKFELSDGDNYIYLNDLSPKDNLYFKIIWNNSDDTYTKIVEEPAVSIYRAS